jgi:hypothetical protein
MVKHISLNRERLLSAKIDLPQETLDFPELGGSLVVRGLSGKDLSLFYKIVKKGSGVDEENFNARLVVASLFDEKGNRLLKDEEFGIVQEWPGSIFNRLVAASMKVNGFASGN